MYSYSYPSYNTRGISLSNLGAGGIIALIIALIAGIVIYFIFDKKARRDYSGKLLQLHDFLNFRKFYLESFLKVLYIIFTIFIAVLSIVMLFSSGSFGAGLLAFLGTLIIGEVVNRLLYEGMLLLLRAVSYLRDIRDDAEELRQYAKTGDDGRTNVNFPPEQ